MVNPWAKDMPETYPYDLEESTAMTKKVHTLAT